MVAAGRLEDDIMSPLVHAVAARTALHAAMCRRHRKLGASSRSEALQRVQEVGLLAG
jgi:hypothetical protein